jgi:Flp pilus assembly protein CpaB
MRLPWRLRRRQPVVFWMVAGLLAAATGLATAAVTNGAEHEREAWGTARVVAVASRDLEPGSVLGVGDVQWEARPVAVLADDAVTEGTATDGRLVAATIRRGEAVVGGRLAPDGLTGISALMPPNTRAISLPPGNRRLDLRLTDVVDLWRGADRSSIGANPGASLVARSATVVATADDGTVTVAVNADDAPLVAAAVIGGQVVIALRRPGS